MFFSSVCCKVGSPISCVITHLTTVLNSIVFWCLMNLQNVRWKCLVVTFVTWEETLSLVSRDFVLFQHTQFDGLEVALITLIFFHPMMHPIPSLMLSDNVSSQSILTTGREATEVTCQPFLRFILFSLIVDLTCGTRYFDACCLY